MKNKIPVAINLEKELDSIATSISKGAHFYDVLPIINYINLKHQLNLSDETVKLLQLESIMRSLAVHYWDKSKNQLDVPKDIKEPYIDAILKSGMISDYNNAKKLFEVGISYYNLVRNASVCKS